MTHRSELRVRPHSDPERKGKIIIEVVRGGEVVANIYGSREGVQIMSALFGKGGENFHSFSVDTDYMPGVVIPLLQPGEECPWCSSTGLVAQSMDAVCPVCQGKHRASTKAGTGKTQKT